MPDTVQGAAEKAAPVQLKQRPRVIDCDAVLVLGVLAGKTTAQHAVTPTEPYALEGSALHHIGQRDVAFPFFLIATGGHADIGAF